MSKQQLKRMDGNKRSHFLHLCGQLLRLVLIPCHVEGEPHRWTRTTALSFAFFSVQRLHGFRQVVQHVQEHVAIGIN